MPKSSVNGQAKTGKKEITNPASDVVRTPDWLIEKMWQWVSEIGEKRQIYSFGEDTRFIDPCAGDGRIMRAIDTAIFCEKWGEVLQIELDGLIFPDLYNTRVMNNTDFFSLFPPAEKYDFCLMNPPFSHCQPFHFAKEIMGNWLKPDGVIIAIAPIYILTQNRERRQWLSQHITRLAFLPQQTFQPVATVHCVLVQLENRPKDKNFPLEFIEIGK